MQKKKRVINVTLEKIKLDIAIAEKSMAELKLDTVVSELDLLCEIYCLTPFNWQSFYLKVFDGEEYTLLYAKPYYKDFLGNESVSTSFGMTLEAENHPTCRGKIFCGIKKLCKDNTTVNKILDCLPKKNVSDANRGVCIDGITTMIVNNKMNPSTSLYFRTGAKFLRNSYTQEQVDFLENLHSHIEEIIGNLRATDKSYVCFREMHIDS